MILKNSLQKNMLKPAIKNMLETNKQIESPCKEIGIIIKETYGNFRTKKKITRAKGMVDELNSRKEGTE